MTYKIGQIIEGKVTGIQPYGAFISLDEQTQGLIHVSEIQSGYTKNINDVIKIGEDVKVQVIDIDEYSQKISLSRRTLEKNYTPNRIRRKRYFTNKNKKIGFDSIEKELPKWIDEALTRLHHANARK
ncbi:CvfD/Ygs/GSP13 family RNA-binding post-transcriptional regulator [Enterococcus mediterraneensis]|uniref:CvfD/Ygs/GSP13 family RNA-binding post-transcriptional regulator n=1 Tax=Enterococcus mediterraneensis TaxID=2364791 RepID=UPI000F071606|nr:CvfD/Ygs/GSP13 family RNA-binding post-transcriptional regulator [Enterococcus mediterraneensis]